jgi:anti-anti-sigma factor
MSFDNPAASAAGDRKPNIAGGEGSVRMSSTGAARESARPGFHTLILIGDLDIRSVHELEVEIERLCDAEVTGITIDLRQLRSIDWIGTRVIAFRCRLCKQRGYEVALVPGPEHIRRAFEDAQLEEALPFIRDLETVDQKPAGGAMGP